MLVLYHFCLGENARKIDFDGKIFGFSNVTCFEGVKKCFFLPLRIACCSCASLVAAAYGCYAEVGWGQAEPRPQALSFTDPSTSLNQP